MYAKSELSVYLQVEAASTEDYFGNQVAPGGDADDKQVMGTGRRCCVFQTFAQLCQQQGLNGRRLVAAAHPIITRCSSVSAGVGSAMAKMFGRQGNHGMGR